MTKKAARKGTALSLRDFYETAPGKAPIEACLPSKPGPASWDAHAVGAPDFSNDYPKKFAPSRRDTYKHPSSFASKGNSDYLGGYGYGGSSQQGGSSGGAGFIKASYERHPGSYHRSGPADQEPPAYGHSRLLSQDAYHEHPSQQQYAPYSRPDSSQLLYQPPPPPPPAPARRPAPAPEPEPVKEEPAAADVRALAAPVRVPPPRPKQAPAVAAACTMMANKPAAEPAKVATMGGSISKRTSSEDEAFEQLPSSAPKNDWAEKMARSALEKMANAKSSLLAGAPPAMASLELFEPQAASAMAADVPDVTVVDPTLLSERPKLNLKPRSQPLAAATAAGQAVQQADAEETAAVATAEPERKQVTVQAAAKDREQRPRLQLQARSKPLTDTEANKDSGARKSIFGTARPREEVLKQRGVNPSSLKGDRTDRGAGAGHTSSRPSSRAASVASGMSDEDAWHTVSSKKVVQKHFSSHAGSHSPVGSYDMPDDVFFGNGRPAIGSYKSVPARPFDNDSSFSGAYGSSYGFSGQDHFDANIAAEDDGPVFRRSLPVRSGQLF